MTTVNARTKTKTAKGTSGRGKQIGTLLREARLRYPDAGKFLDMLAKLDKSYPELRSPFSCAEPHAFAQLLSKGAKLSEIEIVGIAEQKELNRRIQECVNCSKWLFNGQYAEPDFREEVSVEEARRSADLSSHQDFVNDAENLVINDNNFPALGSGSKR